MAMSENNNSILSGVAAGTVGLAGAIASKAKECNSAHTVLSLLT